MGDLNRTTSSTELRERPTGRSCLVDSASRYLHLRHGEGQSVWYFFTYAFLLMVCYYVLKTLREPLLLVAASAEIKSYALAVTALVLLVMVPLYGQVFRRVEPGQLVQWVTGLFLVNLAIFVLLGQAGFNVGFAYYVWVGVFGVTMLAQFWAYAADAYNPASGERLFPAIMVGATLGGLTGPPLVKLLFPHVGPWPLMLFAMIVLATTLLLVKRSRASVPARSRGADRVCHGQINHVLGGFRLVMKERYLLLLALTAVLLNCINSTGEYILTDLVLSHADERVALEPAMSRGDVIAAFYSSYYLTVNAVTLFLQVFLVGHLFRWIGVQGAFLVLPVIALVGYGLMLFVPVFSVIRAVKIFENSADYSVMNTSRHALYLPLPKAEKYEGKMSIDTFFWRFGDLAQAAVIYLGLNWLGFEIQQFALLNTGLALIWIVVAVQISKGYAKRTSDGHTQIPVTGEALA